jgi:CRISPR-associated protein Cmr2
MHSGLFEHLEAHNGKMKDWHDDSWIVHLFGNEKGNKDDLRQGALVFYPTWFGKIDFEVINPHIRVTRAGKTPIYYEVIPPKSNGIIRLLYAAIPGAAEHDRVNSCEALCNLFDAIEMLLVSFGISAKRTAGWGTAKIKGWKAFRRDQNPIEKSSLSEFKDAIKSWR